MAAAGRGASSESRRAGSGAGPPLDRAKTARVWPRKTANTISSRIGSRTRDEKCSDHLQPSLASRELKRPRSRGM